MKYIFSIIMILSVGLFFSGCEKDENGRMPNDIKDSNVGIVSLLETSDMLVDVNQLDEFSLDLKLDVLFNNRPYKRVEVVVVFNGDFTKQYVLGEYTSLPTNVSLSLVDFVNEIDELNSVEDIKEGDRFQIYTNIELPDGTFIPGFHSNGVSTTAPSTRNIISSLKQASAFIIVPVPCPFVPSDFVGVMEVNEFEVRNGTESNYTVDVSINTELSNDDRIVFDISDLWLDGTLFQVAVNLKTYQVTHYKNPELPEDEQGIVFSGNVFGYGRLWFDDFTESVLETCQLYLQFTITPSLNDSGLWWGTEVKYTIGPNVSGDTKKSTGDETPLMLRPIERNLNLQRR